MVPSLALFRAAITVGMMVTSTINIVVKKCAYETYSTGTHDDYHRFKKPWTMTFVMFCGELMCLAAYYSKTAWNARAERK